MACGREVDEVGRAATACEMRSGEPIANDGEHEVLWDGNWLQPPKVLYAISQGDLQHVK